MVQIDNCCLVVVDVQGKLAQLMVEKETLFKNVTVLIRAAKILSIPILWCQQVPKAIGPTIPEVAELLTDLTPIDKASFSCCGEPAFVEALRGLDRPQVLVCGIETHVCIHQTAADLHRSGYETTVIGDAVSSRTAQNKQIALARLQAEGVTVSSVEMTLFELLKTAEHPLFRQVARLIK